jgi:uracil-DNA glycosylase
MSLAALEAAVHECRRCPRLVAWREQVAVEKRAAFRDETYWGRPVGGFGDPDARVLLLGLAPAAHGANRTGRMFTGDRSGDFLYAALHRAGMRDACASWLAAEWALLDHVRVVVALGAFGWNAALRLLDPALRPRPRFGHGAEAEVGGVTLLGCFHPSQQNTFTGKLTPAMIDAVLALAQAASARSTSPA